LKLLTTILLTIVVLGVAALGTAVYVVSLPFPPMEKPRDVFDFATMRRPATEIDPPSIQRYIARDGEELAYRLYESTAERILIFVHGSSYHGLGYHPLAAFLSLGGFAKVVLPNMRGHYLSGRRRGDVEYVGQFEDDIADLIKALRAQNRNGPVTLGGHSSGGGFAIRFAGGPNAKLVSSYLMLAPAILTSPAVKDSGWANLHFKRLFGLIALNTVGIHGLNALPIVEFNKPPKLWDGTETLAYSYRLNVSYHPRYDYKRDVAAVGERALVLIGSKDEAFDANILKTIYAESAPRAQFVILPDVNHLGLITEPAAWNSIAAWLKSLPPAPAE